MDTVNVLLQAGAFVVGERARGLVAAAHVNIHRVRHLGCLTAELIPLDLPPAPRQKSQILLIAAGGRRGGGN